MSQSLTTQAGTPLTSLASPATTADADEVFMLVQVTPGVLVPCTVKRAVLLANVVPLAGGVTLTGPLFLSPDAVPAANEAITRAYVDKAVATAVSAPTAVSLVSSLQAAIAAGLLISNGGVLALPGVAS